MDPAPSLPDDLLADVLSRVAPRGLAVSRCVCKSWRRVVDGRRLLRADLLPLSLGGIFLNLHDLYFTQFLNRPTAGATVSGRLDYTCHASEPRHCPPRAYVEGHCNGLLLFDHCVVNPATRQWALLPSPPEEMPQPPPGVNFTTHMYLVFDPTLSPNFFEVFILPDIPYHPNKYDECEKFEWPPSTLTLPVFSPKSGSWEERTFCREGEAAGMLPGMVESTRICNNRQSAYWQGALYIDCSNCFILRISLSDNKYRVISLPADVSEEDREFYLGKSVKGIYCVSLFQQTNFHAGPGAVKLQVWFLSSLTEWVLQHDRDIFPILPNLNFDKHYNRPWILQEFDYWYEYDASQVSDEEDAMADNNEALVKEVKFDWDSDNDDVLEPGSENKDNYIYILGFHPYKEVVLFSSWDRVLAYHWTSSKFQHLGKLFPKFYLKRRLSFHHPMVTESFSYTPCWLGELPEKQNLEAQLED